MTLLPRMTFLSQKDTKIMLRNFRTLCNCLDKFVLNRSFSVKSFAPGKSSCCGNNVKGKFHFITERSFSHISCENASPYLMKNSAKLDLPTACSRMRFGTFSCGVSCSPDLLTTGNTWVKGHSAVLTTGNTWAKGRLASPDVLTTGNTWVKGRLASPDLLTTGNTWVKGHSAVYHCSVRHYKTIKHRDQPPVINPIDELQKHVAVPLIPQDQIAFSPTEEEIVTGQSIFLPGHKHKIEFLKSAVFQDHLPEYDLPEVGFIGRSNVGKSSLIKMLFTGVPDLSVRVSKTPGHTKTLNFFQVGQKLCVVDMPGYGFNMPTHYRDSVEHFLATRPNLSRIFFLVDASVGVTQNDVIGLNMLEEFHTPYAMTFLLMDSKYTPTALEDEMVQSLQDMNVNFCIVMTKIDRARPALVIRNLMSVLKYRDQTRNCFQQPFLVSSITGDGVALLQTFIAYVTGNVAIEGM